MCIFSFLTFVCVHVKHKILLTEVEFVTILSSKEFVLLIEKLGSLK